MEWKDRQTISQTKQSFKASKKIFLNAALSSSSFNRRWGLYFDEHMAFLWVKNYNLFVQSKESYVVCNSNKF